jgi:glycosyltransferase involved in cell wall biosynthesis
MGIYKVSVIVPCYNVGKLVQPLLKSLEQQDYVGYEVLFVNDGSTDDTGAVLQHFVDMNSPNQKRRYLLLNKENGGQGSARNAGLDRAEGEFVFFVDGDEYLYPQSLSKLAALMTDGIDLAVGAFADHDGLICTFPPFDNRENWLRSTIRKGGLTMWNKMFRRSVIEGHHIRFDTKTRKSEDHLFTAQYLICFDGDIAVTDYPVYFYQFNPMSISNISRTTMTFSSWIADSVFVAVRIYQLLEPHLNSATLRELRYDTYHKYRRIRHEAHVQKCKDASFYNSIYDEIRKVIPVWEIIVFAVRRRLSIAINSIRRKMAKRK